MSKKFTEVRFEEWVEQSLLRNGYAHSFVHSNENSHLYDTQLVPSPAGSAHLHPVHPGKDVPEVARSIW
jgi:hypothetical protein